MKYVLGLVAGLLAGTLLFGALVYLNPLTSRTSISPLAVTASRNQMELGYSAAPADSIASTGSAMWGSPPHPAALPMLWEPTLRNTRVFVSLLSNSRGQLAGVGVKFSTVAEETGVLNGIYPVKSAWHLWLPDRGGMLIEQTENHWRLLRDVMVPAWLSSADSWRGTWFGILTNGPNAIGTGRVVGGSGRLVGITGESVEAINAKAYALPQGPVSMEGRLTISLATEDP